MTDKQLLKGLIKGENKVFSFLYKEYYTMVEYLILQNSGSSQQASDIFQEVMLVLYEKARDNKLYLKASIKTICYSIARNLWLKELRKSGSTVSFNEYEQYVDVGAEESSTAEAYLQNEQFNALKLNLEKMGPPCKPLLTQFYFAKKSLKELMEQFGYQNTNSVKTQKYKCFRRLQKMMTLNK